MRVRVSGIGVGEVIGAGWVRYGMRGIGIVLVLWGMERQPRVGVYVNDDRLWAAVWGEGGLICRCYRKVQVQVEGGRGM